MPKSRSPHGIQFDSPLQRQWMIRSSIGSDALNAATVLGASSSSHRATKRIPAATISSTARPYLELVFEDIGVRSIDDAQVKATADAREPAPSRARDDLVLESLPAAAHRAVLLEREAAAPAVERSRHHLDRDITSHPRGRVARRK